MTFDELLDKLTPEIELLIDQSRIQNEILVDLNAATTELLEKYKESDGLIEQITLLKDKLVETTQSLTDLNTPITSFSDALKQGKTDMDDSMSKLTSMTKSTTQNFGKFIGVAVAGTNKFKELATAAGKAGTAQDDAAKSLKKVGDASDNLKGRLDSNPGGTGGTGSGRPGSSGAAKGGKLQKIGQIAIDVVKGGWEQMTKLEEAFRPLNRQMGLSAENQVKFMGAMNKVAIDTTRKFGIAAKDLGEIQGKLFAETGRIQVMSAKQAEKVAGIAKVMGNQAGAQFVADMDKIGVSTDKAAKSWSEIRSIAGKAGVDMVKATSLVQSNIQKAQSYAFKDGVNSLAQMATKSLQMRMNMEQVFKFSEANRSVEGAVTQAAQTQVLGGAFSSFANPLENLYNSLYDQEASQDRLLGLGSDVMTFDKKSGTMKYKSAADQLRAEAFAKSSGLDIGELQSGWTRAGIGQQIDKELGTQFGVGLDKDQRDLAKSQASWNEDMKAWTVSVREKDSEGNYTYKDKELDQLTSQDLASIQADDSQNIDEIARTTMTIKDKLVAILDAAKTAFGGWVFKNLGPFLADMVEKIGGFFGGLSTGMKALVGGAAVAAGPIGSLALGGVKKLGKNALGAFGKVAKLAKVDKVAGLGRGTIMKNAGKNMLKLGKGSGIAAGLISAGVEGFDQWQAGNFKKSSGNQGKAIGSTAGAGVGGGLGAWGGAAAGAAIGSVVPGIGTAIGGVLGAIVGGLAGSKFGKNIGNAIGKYFDEGGGKAIKEASKKVWGAVSSTASNVWGAMKEKGGQIGSAVGKIWDNLSVKGKQLGGGFSALFKGDFKGAATNFTLLTKNVIGDVVNISKKFGEIGKEFGGWISDAFGKITSKEWWGEKLSNIWESITGFFGPIGDFFKEKFGAIGDWFTEKFGAIGDWFTTAFSNITSAEWWGERISNIKDAIIGKFTSIVDWVSENLSPSAIFNKAKNAVVGVANKVIGKGKEILSDVQSGVSEAQTMDAKTDYVSDMIKTPQGKIMTDPNDVIMAVKPGGSLSTFFSNSVLPNPSVGGGGSGGNIQIPPITINISGSLRLDGASETINLNSLATNRQFVGAITQAVADGINRNMNSGRMNNSQGQSFGNFNRGMF